MKKMLLVVMVISLAASTILPVFAEESAIDNSTDGSKGLETVEELVKYTIDKFSDIEQSDWFVRTVAKLVRKGIINGYLDGTFRPQDSINADAFIKMTVVALKHEVKNGEGYWAQTYIDKAKEIGIVKDGEFSNFTREINRGEIARIIVRAMNEIYSDDIEEYIGLIGDYNSIPDGVQDYVLKAYVKGIITGYRDTTFKAENKATRAEASTILIRMLDESERKIPEKPSNEIFKRTTKLIEEDIKRLQSYECYKLTGDGKISPTYKSFEDMYSEDKSECEAIYKYFHPTKYKDYHDKPIYTNADVKFISSPKLIYTTTTLDNAIRGVVQIRYKTEDNPYNLKPSQWYECDAEYYYLYTTDKEYISKFQHLSKWKLVE
ncbi:S-layer homology domain-containing protein [Wukongibacter baidiensis]